MPQWGPSPGFALAPLAASQISLLVPLPWLSVLALSWPYHPLPPTLRGVDFSTHMAPSLSYKLTTLDLCPLPSISLSLPPSLSLSLKLGLGDQHTYWKTPLGYSTSSQTHRVQMELIVFIQNIPSSGDGTIIHPVVQDLDILFSVTKDKNHRVQFTTQIVHIHTCLSWPRLTSDSLDWPTFFSHGSYSKSYLPDLLTSTHGSFQIDSQKFSQSKLL